MNYSFEYLDIILLAMIAGFIFYSGKLISNGELTVNSFFSFLAAMMLAYQPVRSLATINMIAYEGAVSFRRIAKIIDTPINIKNDKDLPNLEIRNTDIKFKDPNITSNGVELNENIIDDAISAIVNLGYPKSDVFLAVNSVCNEIDNDEKLSIEKIIPLALKKLSK